VPSRAAFMPSEESKVVSSNPRMLKIRQLVRAIIFASLLTAFSAVAVSAAFGKVLDFTISSANGFQPAELQPGETTSADLSLQPSSAAVAPFAAVAFSCTVTSTQVTTNLPTCAVSPSTDTPAAQVSVTVTASPATVAGLYTIAVTGTDASGTATLTFELTVVGTSANYTVSVTTPAVPSSVAQGFGAKATITVTPIGSYTGNVTLFCLSVTPAVLSAPVCSFSPSPLPVTGGAPPTATLTVTTFGTQNTTTAKLGMSRLFYGLWLAVPGLALVGAGAKGKLRKNALRLLLLLVVGGGFLFMPACNTSSNSSPTSPTGSVTPKGSYTFTITGVDENGAAPTNATTGATVTVTVD
jgi:hypothetical protein